MLKMISLPVVVRKSMIVISHTLLRLSQICLTLYNVHLCCARKGDLNVPRARTSFGTGVTVKFDRGLTQLLLEKLHWFDVRDRVTFKLVVVVHRCLNCRARQYLAVHCVPLSSQRHLCSAERNLLHVPRLRLNTYGCLALQLLVRSPGTVFRTLSASELHWSWYRAAH